MPDAFICDYIRTPIGRFGGALASVRTDDLGALPIRWLMERNPGVDWAAVDEVFYGCANQAGEDNRNVARMASLLAGLPESVPGSTLNRLCGSGMDGVIAGARAIRIGEAELVVAGGVESMSRAPFVMPKADAAFSRTTEVHDTTIGWRFVNPVMKAQYGVDSMPETAENVAEEYRVTREEQDAFALRSQERTAAAQASGRLAEEIGAVTIPARRGEPAVVDRDEHPRAAALLLASEAAARRHGLTPIARVLGGASAGVPPRAMGIGPVPAVRKLRARLGIAPHDFGVVELNEAFAAQAVAVLRELGLPVDGEHINRNGGAIALGHPLGMSGARITGTAALELQRSSATHALATMCIGVGQGIAVALGRV